MTARWSDLDQRASRRFSVAPEDQRSAFQRDRDRVLYSSAFRRLGGVTQIARAGDVEVFHNRLTHTLKVAQIGRRVAQDRLAKQPAEAAFHGLDEEVVEAACLAHDLGHPPFGHLGETALNRLVLNAEGANPWPGDQDGYEGNAQSLRIVTKLAARFDQYPGLDLTRASLAACIKYPWRRDPADPSRREKWGVYSTEAEDFAFARETFPAEVKTAEAEIMDWCDDIAYSVHDLEDFHRAGAIPWLRIFSDDDERPAVDLDAIIRNAKDKWHRAPPDADGRLRRAHRRLTTLMYAIDSRVLTEPYEGTPGQRVGARSLTSHLIGRYVNAIELTTPATFERDGTTVTIKDNMADEVRLLKQIARDYIISRTALHAQQRGQAKIVAELFAEFHADISSGSPRFIPKRFHHVGKDKDASAARLVADCIASLTEYEAYALHGRLFGYASGSVLDPIVR